MFNSYPFIYLLPKNLESYCFGKISQTRLPKGAAKIINKTLIKLMKIDMSEAEKPVSYYQTFEDIFTRRLKPGSRPTQGEVCSPCDSILRSSQLVDRGQAIQAKGLNYSINKLLFELRKDAPTFDPHWCGSFYLAPHHYHRIHSPISGSLESIHYIPGELWPVNDSFVSKIPRLYCRNERVVLEIKHKSGGKVFLVMVGALNVGRIKINHFSSLITNKPSFGKPSKARTKVLNSSNMIKIGEELGTFMLGSSVILVFDKILSDIYKFKRIVGAKEIKMGASLL